MDTVNRKKTFKKTLISRERGFSLVELMIAMAITLVVIGAALKAFKTMTDSGFAASQLYEVTQDVQAGLNLIRRDLQKSGTIPEFGIRLTNSANWNNNVCLSDTGGVVDCGSPLAATLIPAGVLATGYTANTSRPGMLESDIVFDSVTPGMVDGTDIISILYYDDFARGIAAVLAGSGVNRITQDDTDPRLNDPDAGKRQQNIALNRERLLSILPGDFVFVENNNTGDAFLQHVTGDRPTAGSLFVNIGITNDPLGFNQNLGSPGDPLTVTLMRRVTYYQASETVNNTTTTWLMRQVNARPATRLIHGLGTFALSYDIITSGTTGLFREKVRGDALSPRQVLDIRRVNVSILCTAPAAPGQPHGDRVKSVQTASIAVLRYFDNMF